MSQQVIDRSPAAGMRTGRKSSSPRKPFRRRRSLSPSFCWSATCTFGILESYPRDACWRSHVASPPNSSLGRIFFEQVAPPGQRLHHRHQRRNPCALAGLLALCALCSIPSLLSMCFE